VQLSILDRLSTAAFAADTPLAVTATSLSSSIRRQQ
jgi:hypothetical protein